MAFVRHFKIVDFQDEGSSPKGADALKIPPKDGA